MQTVSRAAFVKITSSLIGALALAEAFEGCSRPDEPVHGFAPSVWLRVNPDGTVTVALNKQEMGQGVSTGLPTLIAEELDVPLERMVVEFAPADPRYIYPGDTRMSTGGSGSTEDSWRVLRRAGATARAMLVQAAAARWRVDAAACTTRDGIVSHPPSGRHVAYPDLISDAAKLPVPRDVVLKSPEEFRLIGKRSTRRTDAPAKVDGSAKFGMDVALAGMRYASVARSPVLGGTVRHFDATRAKRVAGVLDAVAIPGGVAVVATNTWAAFNGRDALEIQWDEGPGATLHTAGLFAESERVAHDRARQRVALHRGDPDALGGTILEAVYRGPFLAHAAMEPINATADVRDDSCEVWVSTQAPTKSQTVAAAVSGLPREKCTVHPMLIGGGFGRRFEADDVAQAVAISKAIRAPVKVVWTREDDIRNDFYRPMSVNAVRGVLDAHGTLTGLSHAVVSESLLRHFDNDALKKSRGIDGPAVNGILDMLYAVPNYAVRYAELERGIPVGAWRAPNANWNTFVVESFIDELAHAAGADPLAFRLAMLGHEPRAAGVLRLAADKAGWRKKRADGVFQGIALVRWDTYVGMVADVSVEGKRVRVHRVTAAVDCGTAVNPDIVAAQTESAINFGLSAALSGKVTIRSGRIVEGNFDSYRVLHMADAPHIDVHIVPSRRPPLGIGEPALPAIAPAVGNAVFAATGRRVRDLPFEYALA